MANKQISASGELSRATPTYKKMSEIVGQFKYVAPSRATITGSTAAAKEQSAAQYPRKLNVPFSMQPKDKRTGAIPEGYTFLNEPQKGVALPSPLTKYKTLPGSIEGMRPTPEPEFTVQGQFFSDPLHPETVTKFDRDVRDELFKAKAKNLLEKKGYVSRLYEIEHTVPVWLGGTDSDANKQLMKKSEHEIKSRVENVTRELYYGKYINKWEALTMSQTWRDKDVTDVPLANSSGRIPLEIALKKWEEWSGKAPTGVIDKAIREFKYGGVKAAQKSVARSTEDFFQNYEEARDQLAEKGTAGMFLASFANPWLTFAASASKYLGLGTHRIDAIEEKPENIWESIASFTGGLAGQLTMYYFLMRGLSFGLAPLGKLAMKSKAAKTIFGTLKTAKLPGELPVSEYVGGSSIGRAISNFALKKFALGIKTASVGKYSADLLHPSTSKLAFSGAQILKDAGLFALIGQLDQQEEEGLSNRTKKLMEDAAFGGTMAMAGGKYNKVAYSLVGLPAAIITKLEGGTWSDAGVSAATMIGLHGMFGLSRNRILLDGATKGALDYINKTNTKLNLKMTPARESLTKIELIGMKNDFNTQMQEKINAGEIDSIDAGLISENYVPFLEFLYERTQPGKSKLLTAKIINVLSTPISPDTKVNEAGKIEYTQPSPVDQVRTNMETTVAANGMSVVMGSPTPDSVPIIPDIIDSKITKPEQLPKKQIVIPPEVETKPTGNVSTTEITREKNPVIYDDVIKFVEENSNVPDKDVQVFLIKTDNPADGLFITAISDGKTVFLGKVAGAKEATGSFNAETIMEEMTNLDMNTMSAKLGKTEIGGKLYPDIEMKDGKPRMSIEIDKDSWVESVRQSARQRAEIEFWAKKDITRFVPGAWAQRRTWVTDVINEQSFGPRTTSISSIIDSVLSGPERFVEMYSRDAKKSPIFSKDFVQKLKHNPESVTVKELLYELKKADGHFKGDMVDLYEDIITAKQYTNLEMPLVTSSSERILLNRPEFPRTEEVLSAGDIAERAEILGTKENAVSTREYLENLRSDIIRRSKSEVRPKEVKENLKREAKNLTKTINDIKKVENILPSGVDIIKTVGKDENMSKDISDIIESIENESISNKVEEKAAEKPIPTDLPTAEPTKSKPQDVIDEISAREKSGDTTSEDVENNVKYKNTEDIGDAKYNEDVSQDYNRLTQSEKDDANSFYGWFEFRSGGALNFVHNLFDVKINEALGNKNLKGVEHLKEEIKLLNRENLTTKAHSINKKYSGNRAAGFREFSEYVDSVVKRNNLSEKSLLSKEHGKPSRNNYQALKHRYLELLETEPVKLFSFTPGERKLQTAKSLYPRFPAFLSEIAKRKKIDLISFDGSSAFEFLRFCKDNGRDPIETMQERLFEGYIDPETGVKKKYILLGKSSNDMSSIQAIEYKEEYAVEFDKNPTKYMDSTETKRYYADGNRFSKEMNEQSKALKVFLVKDLGYSKELSTKDIVDRGQLLMNRLGKNVAHQGEKYSFRILQSKTKLRDTMDAEERLSWLTKSHGDMETKNKYLDKAIDDGKVYITEQMALQWADANGFIHVPAYFKFKQAFNSEVNGELVLHKGDIQVLTPSMQRKFERLHGIKMGERDVITFSENIKVGFGDAKAKLERGEINEFNSDVDADTFRLVYKKPDVSKASFSLSGLSRLGEGIPRGAWDNFELRYGPPLETWKKINKELAGPMSGTEILAILEKKEYNDLFHITGDNLYEGLRTSLGLGSGMYSNGSKIAQILLSALKERVLSFGFLESATLRVTPDLKWLTTPKGNRYLKHGESIMSQKMFNKMFTDVLPLTELHRDGYMVWRATQKPVEIITLRHPINSQDNMSVQKIFIGDKFGMKNGLKTEQIVLSHEDVLARKNGDYDGDTVAVFGVGASGTREQMGKLMPSALADSLRNQNTMLATPPTKTPKESVNTQNILKRTQAVHSGEAGVGIVASYIRKLEALKSLNLRIETTAVDGTKLLLDEKTGEPVEYVRDKYNESTGKTTGEIVRNIYGWTRIYSGNVLLFERPIINAGNSRSEATTAKLEYELADRLLAKTIHGYSTDTRNSVDFIELLRANDIEQINEQFLTKLFFKTSDGGTLENRHTINAILEFSKDYINPIFKVGDKQKTLTSSEELYGMLRNGIDLAKKLRENGIKSHPVIEMYGKFEDYTPLRLFDKDPKTSADKTTIEGEEPIYTAGGTEKRILKAASLQYHADMRGRDNVSGSFGKLDITKPNSVGWKDMPEGEMKIANDIINRLKITRRMHNKYQMSAKSFDGFVNFLNNKPAVEVAVKAYKLYMDGKLSLSTVKERIEMIPEEDSRYIGRDFIRVAAETKKDNEYRRNEWNIFTAGSNRAKENIDSLPRTKEDWLNATDDVEFWLNRTRKQTFEEYKNGSEKDMTFDEWRWDVGKKIKSDTENFIRNKFAELSQDTIDKVINYMILSENGNLSSSPVWEVHNTRNKQKYVRRYDDILKYSPLQSTIYYHAKESYINDSVAAAYREAWGQDHVVPEKFSADMVERILAKFGIKLETAVNPKENIKLDKDFNPPAYKPKEKQPENTPQNALENVPPPEETGPISKKYQSLENFLTKKAASKKPLTVGEMLESKGISFEEWIKGKAQSIEILKEIWDSKSEMD